jgi:uncharacterized protein YndB with AHSA1/START domain
MTVMAIRLFTHSISIARTPEAVFDFFTDFTQAPRWRRYLRDMHVIGDRPLGGGSDVAVTMDLAGEPHAFTLHVLAFDRPRLWQHRTNEPHYDGVIEYTFEPQVTGTRVTLSTRVRPLGLYGWLGLPLVLWKSGRFYAPQLPSLKRAMEQ